MNAPQHSQFRNQLLSRMPATCFAAIHHDFEPIEFDVRKCLFAANVPIEYLYFPESGIASLTTNLGSSQIEIGLIGREGMVGIHVLNGSDRTPFDCFAQLAGHGVRIPTQRFQQVLEEQRSLHLFLLRYAQVFNVQTAATAFANAEHTVETRLARWLLMCHDRIDGHDLHLTHDFLSMMLGIRRPGVTTAIHVLEGKQLIWAKRGSITVRDREGLEKLADDAYGLPEAEYDRLIQEG